MKSRQNRFRPILLKNSVPSLQPEVEASKYIIIRIAVQFNFPYIEFLNL